jgi:hypothetical protein
MKFSMINILRGTEQENSRVILYTIKNKVKDKAISVTGREGP